MHGRRIWWILVSMQRYRPNCWALTSNQIRKAKCCRGINKQANQRAEGMPYRDRSSTMGSGSPPMHNLSPTGETMGTPNLEKISEIRTTVGCVVRDEPLSPGSTESARNALWSLLQGASKYGLTYADVIRSILNPVFKPRRRCDCPTCTFRRGELEPDTSEPATVN